MVGLLHAKGRAMLWLAIFIMMIAHAMQCKSAGFCSLPETFCCEQEGGAVANCGGGVCKWQLPLCTCHCTAVDWVGQNVWYHYTKTAQLGNKVVSRVVSKPH